jgi:transcriptional regulator with XRE-family HTH domain
MERPPARPEGALLRLARQAAGLSIPEAVRLSGVSKARWSQVESGHETRAGVIRPVQAKADTLARMARAVGVTPERLESEGQRADAAEILREILRAPAERPLASVPEPPQPPSGDLVDVVVHYLIHARPEDRASADVLWRQPRMSTTERLKLLRALFEAHLRDEETIRAALHGEDAGNGNGGSLPGRPGQVGLLRPVRP